MTSHAQGALAALNISHISIRQDAEGRYCINDLHRAAGGEDKHQPAKFLRLDSTKSLIDEIANSPDVASLEAVPPVTSTEGRSGGTFVVIELVYAYAMWISAAFYLQVIRAYHALVQGAAAAPRPALSIADYIRLTKRYDELMDRLKAVDERELVSLRRQIADLCRWLGWKEPELASPPVGTVQTVMEGM